VEAKVRCEPETLPAVAALLREHIPALLGRAIPVTEALVTQDNIPKLPLAIVAPLIQNFTQTTNDRMTVAEDFVIEVWLEPRMENNSTALWAYYNYNKFRNDLFNLFGSWRTPTNGAVRFISLDVESNLLATVMTFRMRATYDVEADADELEEPAIISFNLCTPASPVCLPECEQQEQDPCLPST
jgi:hypothetical protein